MTEKQIKTIYMRQGTRIAQYLPYPQYLFSLDISGTSKLLYALLLNRATLSQKNDWLDGEGRVYIVYTIEAMACDMKKSRTTVKTALAELDSCGLLERKRSGFGKANHLYVKLIEGQLSSPITAGKVSSREPESNPSTGRYSDSPKDENSPTNNYMSNRTNNNLTETVVERTAYGRYRNVLLSPSEYEDLYTDFPDTIFRFIEEMSNYLAATGKTYKNYEAGIRMWASRDKRQSESNQNDEDYSYEEGESY